MLALDHRIFGNGHGMATPHCDGVFYWLSGELYHFSGGLGAQLHSYQWTHPRPGERRKLAGLDWRPFASRRRHGRVSVSWAWTRLPDNLELANRALRRMPALLGRILPPVEGAESFLLRPDRESVT